MYILGISAFYHDSAAALIKDGEIIAACQEERFTRRKHDYSFPKNAIAYCLKEGKIEAGKGTLGKLIVNEKMGENLEDIFANVREISAKMKSGKGLIGKLLMDEQTASNLAFLLSNAAELSDKLNKGEGTLGKLINEDELLTEMKGLLKSMREALEDKREQAPIDAFSSIFFGALR